ncbi:ChaN family lipoprotein [Pelovirga terrestris]|uniref:ChaN family lipoprotein n=1 Tax=Pelovirga terrestris TaxID=2771352 RepID=A0A8J6QQL1_9BACT|nr:ChaN family lipoprotein [Pelovirga terrestris]MBD1400418.1 ChaN family lipoprotein [Pelovirga terrestris]
MRSVRMLLLITIILWFQVISASAHPHILHVATGEILDFRQLVEKLEQTRVVFIGEQHDHAGHHQMQLEVIRTLAKQQEVAIGLEMFQAEDQQALDDWIAGTSSVEEFRQIYQRNWGWWSLYEPIFSYARQQQIPMVGINLPRSITRQVAISGFSSLDQEQVSFLGGMTCSVDATYEDFIRRAVGSHGHGSFDFLNFCEAQLVWDKAMAGYMSRYIQNNPKQTAIVLAGNGHAWKYGIPTQMADVGYKDYLVLLPEVAGRLTRHQVTLEDADFLWLDEGEGSWIANEEYN